MCSPCFSQCPLASSWIPFPNFDAVVGRSGEDASAIKVDVEDRDSVMVARLKVVNCRHIYGNYAAAMQTTQPERD